LKFFVDIHAAIDHPNDGNVIAIDGVENQVKSGNKTPQPGSEVGAFPADEGKSREIFETLIDPANEIIGGGRTALVEILKNSKQVRPGFVREDDRHPASY
jgi:precorrin-6B methylase 2